MNRTVVIHEYTDGPTYVQYVHTSRVVKGTF